MTLASQVIQTVGLRKDYGDVRALRGVELTVETGEVFGFLGPNGAGKTTMIRLLTGFIRPTAGRVSVFGMDAWRDRVAIARELGFLPENGGLDDGRTGAELLDYLTRLQGRPPLLRDALLERFDLPHSALRRRIKTYSQGMRQKLALVQALQHDPALVILDEPTIGLDPLVQQSFFDLVSELRDRGRTIFMSSHTLSDVERLCDRVGIIRDGELVMVDRIETLRGQGPRRMEVTFMEDPPLEMTTLPSVVDATLTGRTWHLTVRGDLNPLIRELARYELKDLVFEKVRIEDVFLDYYRSGGDPP